MKKILLSVASLMLVIGGLQAQVKNDSTPVVRKYYEPTITSSTRSIVGVAESKEAYYKGLNESQKTTPIFKYVASSDKRSREFLSSPADTVITPTMRYYPGKPSRK
jgi:hypothetical protein